MEKDIIELQIKVAHQEDLLMTLNDIVAQMQKQIDSMAHQLRFLEEQARPDSPGDEPPPHY